MSAEQQRIYRELRREAREQLELARTLRFMRKDRLAGFHIDVALRCRRHSNLIRNP